MELRILGFYFLFLSFLLSCQSENKTINVYSYEINGSKEKMDILHRYLTNQSGLLDAEYHIWYQDNSRGLVLGPSDNDMKFALKVSTDSRQLDIFPEEEKSSCLQAM